MGMGGAWILAFIAGIINVVGLLGLNMRHTHLTGNTSRLAASPGRIRPIRRASLGGPHWCFVAGTVISGFIIQDSTLSAANIVWCCYWNHYCCLFPFHFFKATASSACILQLVPADFKNAMVSTYSRTVVAYAHLSGMFTDLGISLGHVDAWTSHQQEAFVALLLGYFRFLGRWNRWNIGLSCLQL